MERALLGAKGKKDAYQNNFNKARVAISKYLFVMQYKFYIEVHKISLKNLTKIVIL